MQYIWKPRKIALVLAALAGQDHDKIVPRGVRVWVLFKFFSTSSGSGSQTLMIPTLMLAVLVSHHEHGQKDPMGPRDQVLMKFSS